MPLHLVSAQNYVGLAGVIQIRQLQEALSIALNNENWDEVRRLDQTCTYLVDRVIEANKDNRQAVIDALSELKDVYAGLILQCQTEVTAMAH